MTHIRMSRWESKPGMDEESLRLWDNGVLDMWRAQPGLLHVYLLARPGTTERMTMSIWESADAYQAFLDSGALGPIADAYSAVYAPGTRPVATEWNVVTDDWPDARPRP